MVFSSLIARADDLHGDSTVFGTSTEDGNLTVEGPTLTLGGDWDNNVGQLEIKNDIGYNLASFTLMGMGSANWQWGYNQGLPQMTLAADNTLSLWPAYGVYFDPTIQLIPGVSTDDAAIYLNGNPVLTSNSPLYYFPPFVLSSPNGAGVVVAGGGGAPSPNPGAGTRMMWYAAKSAFRAGGVGLTNWNEANTGLYSTAFGFDNKASGNYSTAMGNTSVASGSTSTAMGRGTASGSYSTAMGFNTTAANYASVALGQFNESKTTSGSATAWQGTGAVSVLEVGVGTSTTAKKNAMTVYQNGTVELGKASTATGNASPLVIKDDGAVIISKAQGDISMGIYE